MRMFSLGRARDWREARWFVVALLLCGLLLPGSAVLTDQAQAKAAEPADQAEAKPEAKAEDKAHAKDKDGKAPSTLSPESVKDLQALQDRVEKVVNEASKATVSVMSGGGAGSGVVISEDGYVLTAGHVAVQPGRRVVFIFPDGKRVMGKSLGINIGVDAGLMKITGEGKWPHVEMGVMKNVKPGAWVVALGHPGGFDKERSVVARLGRVLRTRRGTIQTDCTIIGGDSGGPLFDLDGKVVGIHSRISTSLRQNYHVPISEFTLGWDKMAAGKVWNRPAVRGAPKAGGPYIGVQGAAWSSDGDGAKLDRIYANSPADKAGLKSGDLVVEFDKKPIGSFGDLATLVRKRKPGETVNLTVKRGKKKVELKLVIGKSPG